MLSTSFWTKLTSSSYYWRAFRLNMEFSFWSNFTRLLKSLIYEAASLSDSDLSSSYLRILAIISLFWFACLSNDSFDVIFISLINFWLAVYSPFRDTLEPDTDPTRDPAFDPTLDPVVTLACYFSVSYIWHFPILISGWGWTVKNRRFFVFSMSKLTRSFCTLSTRPPIM